MASPALRPSEPHPEKLDTALGLLGVIAMMGAPMLLIGIITGHLTQVATADLSQALLSVLYLAGFLASVNGLMRLGVAGGPGVAATLFRIQALGILLAFGQVVMDLLYVGQGTLYYKVCDLAWPASHLFMLVVGILAIHTARWTGWRRYVPLACGLALPVALLVGRMTNHEALNITFGISTAITFSALGYAVWTGEDTEKRGEVIEITSRAAHNARLKNPA